MSAKILKFWHQYGFLITIIGYIFMMGTIWQAHKDAIASTQNAIEFVEKRHERENIDNRVTKLEQIASDNKESFDDIKQTERAIFDRINQIGDKNISHR